MGFEETEVCVRRQQGLANRLMHTKIINQSYTVNYFLFAQTLFTTDHQTNVQLIRQTVTL